MKTKKQVFREGFTLIELLVVIAIIGILASLILFSIQHVKAKARDAKRLSDMRQIQEALELYRGDHGRYPSTHDPTYGDANSGCGGWDIGLPGDPFIPELSERPEKYMTKVPVDPKGFDDEIASTYCEYGCGYSYFYYPPGSPGTEVYCPLFSQGFYVLRARLETKAAAKNSPGFVCYNADGTVSRDWTPPASVGNYYVTGAKQ